MDSNNNNLPNDSCVCCCFPCLMGFIAAEEMCKCLFMSLCCMCIEYKDLKTVAQTRNENVNDNDNDTETVISIDQDSKFSEL